MVKTLPSHAGSECLIPGQGTKIPHASGPKNQNIKQKQCCNKFSKDLKIKKKDFLTSCLWLGNHGVSKTLDCKAWHFSCIFKDP